ncbi:hypothetical protein [Streptosporangium vulgare]|uniref:PASTA domain-containing protein n=1 Tax=Streptosporangium vulgare TaxID=46190 RepID=A0ABV5TLD6_9ACTN
MPVVATLAAATVVAGRVLLPALGIGPAPTSAALDIKREDDHYIITVKDLFADPETYQSELRARGLDITLKLLPTSASRARSVFVINSVDLVRAGRTAPAEGGITTVDAPGPCPQAEPDGCPASLKVPAGYRQKAEIVLGREARPGERYMIPPGLGMPGEPLHCVEYVNRTVTEVLAMLRERGVEPEFALLGPRRIEPSVPGDWYVHDGVMSAAGRATVLTDPAPNPTPQPLDASCPGGS